MKRVSIGKQRIIRLLGWSMATVALLIAIAVATPLLAYQFRDRSKVNPHDSVQHAQSLIDDRISPGMPAHEAINAARDLGFDCSGELYELLPEFESHPLPPQAVKDTLGMVRGPWWFAIVHPSIQIRIFLDEAGTVVEARAKIFITGP